MPRADGSGQIEIDRNLLFTRGIKALASDSIPRSVDSKS